MAIGIKSLSITVLLLTLYGNIFSQVGVKLSESDRLSFEQKIIEQSQKIESLQCDFIQEKTSSLILEKSATQGVMLYQAPSKLRWEYTKPTPSTLIINGNSAVLLDKNGQKSGDEKILKQLGSIIISMINGSGITQNKQFSTDYYEFDNSLILVVLTPIQKRLKDFYEKIEMKIDPKTKLANEIVLFEKTGDTMSIILTNKILNTEISQNKFETQ